MDTCQNTKLQNLLYDIWDDHFPDVPRKNLVIAKYGKFSKQRLGSIKWVRDFKGIKSFYKKFKDEHEAQDDKRITLIILTRYFTLPEIPDFLVKTTLAHELTHYAHGFNSPLEKKFKYPHQGKIIEKELKKRGLGKEYDMSEKWLKENWKKFVNR
jgi:hypothetical protein